MKGCDKGHLNIIYWIFLFRGNVSSLHTFLRLYFKCHKEFAVESLESPPPKQKTPGETPFDPLYGFKGGPSGPGTKSLQKY